MIFEKDLKADGRWQIWTMVRYLTNDEPMVIEGINFRIENVWLIFLFNKQRKK